MEFITIAHDSISCFLPKIPMSVKVLIALTFCFAAFGCSQSMFENKSDIGKIKLVGSADYDSQKHTYIVTGSGENIWGNEDAFFFLWNDVKGDLTLRTDIELIGEGNHPHRKAGLMIRAGLDDGPDYSPDGQYFYFNSIRTGQMKIWRMESDSSEQKQITPDDEYGDWFPHPSPDGNWLVFASYDKNVEGHPPNKNVVLRIMPTSGGEPKILATLFGGQGTINIPSWSADSKNVAFVSYRLVAP